MDFIGLFVFVFGLIVGSFLNVVILRYKSGRGLNGRSFCFSCGEKLGVFELIPVLSFLAQKGKCKTCRVKISWQYPVVELITGFLFYSVFYKLYPYLNDLSLFSLPYHLFIISLLIVISVYDIKHKIIPDSMSFLFAGVTLGALLSTIAFDNLFIFPQILDTFSGFIMALPFFLIWFFSGGTLMGLGDAKLALGIGWMLGFVGAVNAIVLAFWIGAILGLTIIIWSKLKNQKDRITLKSEIPFAPFLILGTLLQIFFQFDILKLHEIFGL